MSALLCIFYSSYSVFYFSSFGFVYFNSLTRPAPTLVAFFATPFFILFSLMFGVASLRLNIKSKSEEYGKKAMVFSYKALQISL